jgi:hypothetical protein
MDIQRKISKYVTGREYYQLNEEQKKAVDEKVKMVELVRKRTLELRRTLRNKGFVQGKWYGGSMIKGAGSYSSGFIIETRFPTANFIDVSYNGSEEDKIKFFNYLKTLPNIKIEETEVYFL